MVPLTIPWMRSIGVAASDSWSTRMTGTTPADGRLEAQPDAVLAGRLEELLAVLAEQLLVRGDDVLAGAASPRSRYSRAGSIPPISSTSSSAVGEDLLEAARASA